MIYCCQQLLTVKQDIAGLQEPLKIADLIGIKLEVHILSLQARDRCLGLLAMA